MLHVCVCMCVCGVCVCAHARVFMHACKYMCHYLYMSVLLYA